MAKIDIIRAWKDEEYRMSLAAGERAQLPANPAGIIELQEAELEAALRTWLETKITELEAKQKTKAQSV